MAYDPWAGSTQPYSDFETEGLTIGELSPEGTSIFDGLSDFNAASMVPALTSLIGIAGTAHDIDAKNDALMTNMRNQAKSLAHTQGVNAQQLQDLDRVVGDKMTASGLEALKTEGRLKAASAETGATGTSNAEAIQTATVNQLHNEAAILRTYDIQKSNTQQQMIASRLGFENSMESMMSGQQSAESAFLQSLSSGLSGMNQGIMMLNGSQRENFFGTNTSGVA